jgi:hypothetical protein
MMIRIDLAVGLRTTKWHDYAIRFLFGGLITAAAGLIAHRWGPGIGGLFLPFQRSSPPARRWSKNMKSRRRTAPAFKAPCADAKPPRSMQPEPRSAVSASLDSRLSFGNSLGPTRPGSFSAAPACCGWGFRGYAGEP